MVSHPRQKSTFYIHNNFLFSTQLFIFNTTFYFQHNFLFSTQLFIFNTTFFSNRNPLIYHGSRARFCTLMISPVTTIQLSGLLPFPALSLINNGRITRDFWTFWVKRSEGYSSKSSRANFFDKLVEFIFTGNEPI